MKTSNLVAVFAIVVGIGVTGFSAASVQAASSPHCQSSLNVVPDPAFPFGGHDPENPEHWKPKEPDPATPANFNCQTLACEAACAPGILPLNPQTNPPTYSVGCACPDVGIPAPGGGTQPGGAAESFSAYCRAIFTYQVVTPFPGVQIVINTKAGCSAGLDCTAANKICKFEVSPGPLPPVADCNCN